jgi:1-acyl-sn-glycerol-3-phosphate acyltransferase
MTTDTQQLIGFGLGNWPFERTDDLPRTSRDMLGYRIGRTIPALYARLMLNLDLVTCGSVPEGPKILAANHPTTTDPFLMLTWFTEPISILVTGAAFQIPVFGSFLRRIGHIPVAAGQGRQAVAEGVARLAAGQTVGVFPEGRLSPEGGLAPMRTGAARLVLSSGAPVIPIGIALDRSRVRNLPAEIDGSTEVAKLAVGGPYAVTIGEPLSFCGDANDRLYVREVAAQIGEHIAALSRQSAGRLPDVERWTAPALTSIRNPQPVT